MGIKEKILGKEDKPKKTKEPTETTPATEPTKKETAAAIVKTQLDVINASLNSKLKNADKSGPWHKIKDAFRRLQANNHFREFNSYVGENVMEAIRFIAKNKDFFVEIIELTALEIIERKGELDFDDIDDLIGGAFQNSLNVIDASPEKIEFDVEWIEMAIRILIFILKNSGKLG